MRLLKKWFKNNRNEFPTMVLAPHPEQLTLQFVSSKPSPPQLLLEPRFSNGSLEIWGPPVFNKEL